MKFNFKYLAMLLTIFIVSCTTAEYEEPGDISTVGFYNSKGQDTQLYVAEAGQMTFSDLSQGAIGHAWTIESGNFFLKGPFLRNDNYKVFENNIINEGDTISNAASIIVYFKKTGLNKVRLYNEFKDSVTFPGYNKATETAYTLGSHKVGNKWVIDTTFVVNVLDSIIPSVQVKNSSNVVVDHIALDTVTVEAGDPLFFENTTTIGGHNRTLWTAKRTSGGNSVAASNEENFGLLLKSLGFYNVTITLNRIDPNLPGDSEQYKVPLVIEVIPSTKPFELVGDIIEAEDQTIKLGFNGEIESSIGDNFASFFEVKVNGADFTVSTATVNQDDPSIIDIKLAETIYSDDTINVTMLPNSGIVSVDSRTPVVFTEQDVVMYDKNLLSSSEVASFENAGASWLPFAPNWGKNEGTIEYVTDKAVDGDYSIKLSTIADQRSAINTDPANSLALTLDPATTYIVSYKMYIEDATAVPDAIQLFLIGGPWLNVGTVSKVELEGYGTGSWVTIEKEFNYTGGDVTRLYFRTNKNATNQFVFYLDDFYIGVKDKRP
ncbi:hypothetical protein [Wenyingzhuangia sp. IMCC45574]